MDPNTISNKETKIIDVVYFIFFPSKQLEADIILIFFWKLQSYILEVKTSFGPMEQEDLNYLNFFMHEFQ